MTAYGSQGEAYFALEGGTSAQDGRSRLRLLLIYLAFVVYGSLVPLQFQGHELTSAWAAFLQTPYYELGVYSRADWIANIVLYIPVGFLAAGWLARAGDSRLRRALVHAPLILLVAGGFIVGIEFLQKFFPPRSVTLNDLLAEFIGTTMGIVAWHLTGARVARLWRHTMAGGTRGALALMALYAGAYFALSLFPYDFVVSSSELWTKWSAGSSVDLWLSSDKCTQMARCGARIVAEIAAVVPLGVLLAAVYARRRRLTHLHALLLGLAVGVTIEAAQAFVWSGVSQGISVLTRGLGVLLGFSAWRLMPGLSLQSLRSALGRGTLLLSLPYLALLLALNEWFSGDWVGLPAAMKTLSTVRFTPFYYHYYTSEQQALLSMLVHAAMYAPIGFGYWAWQFYRGAAPDKITALGAALYAGFAALVMETGKLFLAGEHPDPTDVIIAAAAAGGVCWLAARLSVATLAPTGHPAEADAPGDASGALVPGQDESAVQAHAAQLAAEQGPTTAPFVYLRRLGAAGLVAVVVAVLLDYPLGAPVLGLALLLYAGLLWWRPKYWLFVVPALLPVLDLAPWTGWFFLDEFDLFLVTTLAVLWWQRTPATPATFISPRARLVIGALALSYLVSLLIGLLPLQQIDLNAFSSYYSRYNALREAKGFFLALLFLPFLARALSEPANARRYLLPGLALGLLATVAVVMWERETAVGLLDFERDFRITAAFSGMHTGGADLEAYLAAVLPMILVWILVANRLAVGMIGAVLLMLGTYALVVTYSRGGYLAYGTVFVVLGAALLVARSRRRFREAQIGLVFILLMLAGGEALVLVAGSEFASTRLSAVIRDLGSRAWHWSDAVQMMDDDAATRAFGMGLGRFPDTYLWRSERPVIPGTHRFEQEGENRFLRLGAGDPVYIEQILRVRPDTDYALKVRLRSARPGQIRFALCEKALKYSFRCQWLDFDVVKTDGAWHDHEARFNTGAVGQGTGVLKPLVKLSTYNSRSGSTVDVDDVSLRMVAGGEESVRNGDFSAGHDFWFFAPDDNWPWDVAQLWVYLLFGQGWFGVVAFGLLITYVFAVGLRALGRGEMLAAGTLAGLTGMLTTGLFGSVLSTPRLAFLLYLLALSTMLLGARWRVRSVPGPGAGTSSTGRKHGV